MKPRVKWDATKISKIPLSENALADVTYEQYMVKRTIDPCQCLICIFSRAASQAALETLDREMAALLNKPVTVK